jgi:uncharacterized protein
LFIMMKYNRHKNQPAGSKSPLRYIIRRFADKAAMEIWDNSEESLKLLKEANDYSTRHYDTAMLLHV